MEQNAWQRVGTQKQVTTVWMNEQDSQLLVEINKQKPDRSSSVAHQYLVVRPPDQIRICLWGDFWEMAVWGTDHIAFISSQLNSLCLDKKSIHNIPKFNLNLQDHWCFILLPLSFNQKLYEYPSNVLPVPPQRCKLYGRQDSQTQRQVPWGVGMLLPSYILWRMKGAVGNLYACSPLKKYPFSVCHLSVISD